MNLTLPIASSSDAISQTLDIPHVLCLAPHISREENSLGWRVGWRMATRSFCRDHTYISQAVLFSSNANSPNLYHPETGRILALPDIKHQRTFSICNSVVLPALSRPRNRSFACLFISPRAERVSQTVYTIPRISKLMFFPWRRRELRGGRDAVLTPVDDPHAGQMMGIRNRCEYAALWREELRVGVAIEDPRDGSGGWITLRDNNLALLRNIWH